MTHDNLEGMCKWWWRAKHQHEKNSVELVCVYECNGFDKECKGYEPLGKFCKKNGNEIFVEGVDEQYLHEMCCV